ncbi:MAG: response regulator [Saprospiraceae bacterium]|nr:response regulator [Saprospiraceae bacterium]
MYGKNIINILLIEDNEGDVQLIKNILDNSSLKHTLTVTDMLFESLSVINNQTIHIILLDLTLPDSSGFKTLKSLLENVKQIPIIVLTGVNNDIIGDQVVRAGAQDYLVKGHFDDKLLLKSIKYSLQRHKVQTKLEELATEYSNSEKRFLEAQQMARFGSWEMDIVTNKMRWSDEMYRIFGFSPNAFEPKLSDYIGYTHNDDKAAVETFFEKVVQKNSTLQIEHRIVVNGQTTIRYLALQSKIYFDEITEKLLLLGVVQDISERKQNEFLILEQNINRKSSVVKDEILRDLSFYIRTPLSTIVNLLYLLETSATSLVQKDYLDKIKTSTEDLSSVINNLLNYTMLNFNQLQVENEEVDLQELMNNIKKIIQLKAGKNNLQIHFTSENLPERCICDAHKLTQVIFNLLDSNILQFVKNSSALYINIGTQQSSNHKTHLIISSQNPTLVLPESRINELSQSDTLLETIDDKESPFNKLNIGLAVAIQLVKVMNGTLNITSDSEKGTFYITQIPIETSESVKVERDGSSLIQAVKILLVEDHFLNQIATKKLLTTWSDWVTVDIAENGMIGYEKFKEHGYDLILMDLQMPIMNGFEATQRIRQISSVPIIALTASSSKQEETKCFDVGMNDYIVKPFKPEELFDKISASLQESRARTSAII